MIRRMTLLTGAALVLALTGCLEEDKVITLMPDGKHGKLVFERALGGQMAEMMRSMGGDAGGEGAKDFAASQLASMEGISAWTDVEASVGEDGKIRVKATGWFEDLSQVVQAGDSQTANFSVEHGEGTVTVTMQETTGDEDEGDDDSLLSQSDEEYAMAKQMTKGMIGGMLEGLRLSLKLELPGEVQSVQGFTQEGNTVTLTRSSEEILGLIDKMFEIADTLRPKVKSGELTAKQAEEQMKAQLQEQMVFSVTAKLPTGTDATLATFKEELAAAKTAYEAGEWKAAIEKAKAEEAAAGEMGDMGDMGDDEEPRSDSEWNESAAVAALKTLATAQSIFREGDKDGNSELDYAADLAALGACDLIDSVLASGTKQGYRFSLVRSKKAPEFLWMAVASPVEPGTSGSKHYAINHEGVVYSGDSAFQTNDDCKISGGNPVR